MKPIIDKNTEILILGTYPGEETIKKQEYYSDVRNNFWELVGIKRNLSYEDKINVLKKLRIGVWDIFKSVKREGCADKNIISGELNDFNCIIKECKKLRLVVINGKTIKKRCKKMVGKNDIEKFLVVFKDVAIEELYSSSGANNGKANERKVEWSKALSKTHK